MPLAPDVYRIPTAPRSWVNTFAFVDEGGVTLVDCGIASAAGRIVAGLAAIGKTPREVSRILLTHAHPDHAGGASEVRRRTGAPVLAHAADAEFAEIGKSPPADPSTFGGRLVRRLTRNAKFEPIEVAQRLGDGDVLDVGGGLRVLHTPGHSPGHVSLLHQPSGLLITGDAIFNVAGLRRSPAFLCSDVRLTERTMHVLGDLDYEIVAFTHGREIRHQARERVRRLLSRFASAR